MLLLGQGERHCIYSRCIRFLLNKCFNQEWLTLLTKGPLFMGSEGSEITKKIFTHPASC